MTPFFIGRLAAAAVLGFVATAHAEPHSVKFYPLNPDLYEKYSDVKIEIDAANGNREYYTTENNKHAALKIQSVSEKNGMITRSQAQFKADLVNAKKHLYTPEMANVPKDFREKTNLVNRELKEFSSSIGVFGSGITNLSTNHLLATHDTYFAQKPRHVKDGRSFAGTIINAETHLYLRGRTVGIDPEAYSNYSMDPVLSLYQINGETWTEYAFNDDWKDDRNTAELLNEIETWFGFDMELQMSPGSYFDSRFDRNSAITVTVDPGVYISVLSIFNEDPRGVGHYITEVNDPEELLNTSIFSDEYYY